MPFSLQNAALPKPAALVPVSFLLARRLPESDNNWSSSCPCRCPKKTNKYVKPWKRTGSASAAGDVNAEHDIYADDAICDYPQSGERILGRSNLQALRSHHPGKPSGFNVRRILGSENLWITEYTITYHGRPAYTVSIMEFRNRKVVHETQYFADPFEAPDWRRQWVQRIA